MDWSKNAICKLTDKEGWTNPNFDMIFGYVGKGLDKPNERLRPIEDQARKEGKAFGLWYKFHMGYYTGQQYPFGDESQWPDLAMDYPRQYLQRAIQDRDCKAVVIEVTDATNHAGDEHGNWISYAARTFIKLVDRYIRETKPGVKLYVATSHEWCEKHSPQMLSWIHEYQTVVIQQRVKPLAGAYPDPTEKPAYIGNSSGWKFWQYYKLASGDNLILFSGTPAALAVEVGGKVPPQPEPQPKPEEPAPEIPSSIEQSLDRIVVLCERMTADIAAIRSVFRQ